MHQATLVVLPAHRQGGVGGGTWDGKEARPTPHLGHGAPDGAALHAATIQHVREHVSPAVELVRFLRSPAWVGDASWRGLWVTHRGCVCPQQTLLPMRAAPRALPGWDPALAACGLRKRAQMVGSVMRSLFAVADWRPFPLPA